MGVINLKAEQREISEWLTSIGCHETDQHLILDRLKVDQEAHLRYLNNARKARAKAKH